MDESLTDMMPIANANTQTSDLASFGQQLGMMLTNQFGGLQKNISYMQESYNRNCDTMKVIRVGIDEQKRQQKRLFEDNEDQRKQMSKIINDLVEKKENGEDIFPLSKELKGSELATALNGQRIAFNLELSNMQKAIIKPIYDTTDEFSSKTIGLTGDAMTPLDTLEGTVTKVINRVATLEASILSQKNVNDEISRILGKDDVLTRMNDFQGEKMLDIVKDLIRTQIETKKENEELKNNMEKMKETFIDAIIQLKAVISEQHKEITNLKETTVKIGKRKRQGIFKNPEEADEEITAILDSYTIEESNTIKNKVLEIEHNVDAAIVAINSRIDANQKNAEEHINVISIHLGELTQKVEPLIQAAEDAKNKDEKEVHIENLIKACKKISDDLYEDINMAITEIRELRDIAENAGEPEYLLNSDACKDMMMLQKGIGFVVGACGYSPNAYETFDFMYPILDRLTIDVLELLDKDATKIDKNGQKYDDSSIILADIPVPQGDDDMRHKIKNFLITCYELLDERVDKITMRRRLDNLDTITAKKAEQSSIEALEKEIQGLEDRKANMLELQDILAKKVSLGELTQLKEKIMRDMESLSANMNHLEEMSQHSHDSAAVNNIVANNVANVSMPLNVSLAPLPQVGQQRKSVDSKGLKELQNRFELLVNQFNDLKTDNLKLVPRDEIEEAMTGLLAEMKNLRLNSVTPKLLEDSLNVKADKKELNKLLKQLAKAVGNVDANSSAGAKSKCLLCDKPVPANQPLTPLPSYAPLSPNQLVTSSSTSALDIPDVRPSTSAARLSGGSMYSRLTSPDPTIRDREVAKVVADVTVLKSTMDLPPIQDSLLSSENRSIKSSKTDIVKSRVRNGNITQNSR
jgi:hypothetical protein